MSAVILKDKHGQKYTALCSPIDFHILKSHFRTMTNGYASGSVNGKKWLMHRFVWEVLMKHEVPKGYIIDHVNKNKLDCQRENLRIATKRQNSLNVKKRKNASSAFYGVCKDGKKFVAFATDDNGRRVKIARVDNELEAAEKYDTWVKQQPSFAHGFRPINFLNGNDNTNEQSYAKKPRRKITGVTWSKEREKYVARVSHNGNMKFIGRYDNETDAAHARDAYIVNNDIQSAKLSFPEDFPDFKKQVVKCGIQILDTNTARLITRNHFERVVLIDIEDYERLKTFAFYVVNDETTQKPVRVVGRSAEKMFYLHRFIMNVSDESVIIDHINRNPLDNRKNNLRFSTHQKNSRNRQKMPNTSSQYMGVCFLKRLQKFYAKINFGHNKTLTKYFEHEEFAARFRDMYIMQNLANEHYVLNFEWADNEVEEWLVKLNL
jgi:hypothetical protein